MSNNTQMHVEPKVHVSQREYFSIDNVLGVAGAKMLNKLLGNLTTSPGLYPEKVCGECRWQASAQPNTYTTEIGAHHVQLRLTGSVPELTMSGMQSSQTRNFDPAVRAAAHRAVNQLLALAVTECLTEKLQLYVRKRMQINVQQQQTVTLRAVNLATNRIALRATCGIRIP